MSKYTFWYMVSAFVFAGTGWGFVYTYPSIAGGAFGCAIVQCVFTVYHAYQDFKQ